MGFDPRRDDITIENPDGAREALECLGQVFEIELEGDAAQLGLGEEILRRYERRETGRVTRPISQDGGGVDCVLGSAGG